MSLALPIPAMHTITVRRTLDLARTVGTVTVVAFAAQICLELGMAAWLDTMLFGAGAPPPEAFTTAHGMSVEVGPVEAQSATKLDMLVREAARVQSIAVASIWFLAAGVAVLMMREDGRPWVRGVRLRPGVPVPLSPTAA
jgi:hypothetical protein